MFHIALLRGINVGGHKKVDMKELKTCFEELGFLDVCTYINSGNVIFRMPTEKENVNSLISTTIFQRFGFSISTLLRDQTQIESVCAAVPKHWKGNATKIIQVIFLGDDIDTPDILDHPSIRMLTEDEVCYVPGAILWNMDRETYSRNTVYKYISSASVKEKVTVRTLGTVEKLVTLCQNTPCA